MRTAEPIGLISHTRGSDLGKETVTISLEWMDWGEVDELSVVRQAVRSLLYWQLDLSDVSLCPLAGRVAKMAFVNSAAKPPRDVRRRQKKFGTGGPLLPEKTK